MHTGKSMGFNLLDTKKRYKMENLCMLLLSILLSAVISMEMKEIVLAQHSVRCHCKRYESPHELLTRMYTYRIVALFGACTYSRKNTFWKIIENFRCACIITSRPFLKTAGGIVLGSVAVSAVSAVSADVLPYISVAIKASFLKLGMCNICKNNIAKMFLDFWKILNCSFDRRF